MRLSLAFLGCLIFVFFTHGRALAGDNSTSPSQSVPSTSFFDFFDDGGYQTSIPGDEDVQKLGCVADPGPATYQGVILHQGCLLAGKVELTGPFHLKHASFFEITQGPNAPNTSWQPGLLSFCFLQNDETDCQYAAPNSANGFNVLIFAPYILYPSKDAKYPLIVAAAQSNPGAGTPPVDHMIWAYDPRSGKFQKIMDQEFDGLEYQRFMTGGPLAGDMIETVDDPTGRWPWRWGIEVYKFVPPLRYVKILSFIGKAAQAGNTPAPDAVVDIDMPQILQRLHVSQ